MIRILKGKQAGYELISRARTLDEKRVGDALAQKLRGQFGRQVSPDEAVAQILADVRARGDAAVLDWTAQLDGVNKAALRVPDEEIEAAAAETPTAVREALEIAATRIRAFHEAQKPHSWLEWSSGGGALGQNIRPLERVGIYVPGGTAPLPSSLLMSAVPAQVAGVAEIVITTPPSQQGRIAPVILAATRTIGLTQVFAVGGAQAIGALAFGTASIPKVDKIVGAGGLFTTLAKRQVFGRVGIDGLYGPTETLLIADDTANPSWVAADLLAQAEHDVLATSILITTCSELARAVQAEIEKQMAGLSRRSIIQASLDSNGALVLVDNLEQAVELANAFGPEHLCLLVRNPWSVVPQVHNAGGVFVGEWSSEGLGDYVLGPSHVMPTGGTARFSSPLSVNDFVKITSVLHVSPREARALSRAAQVLAEAEGLTAHANAIGIRL